MDMKRFILSLLKSWVAEDKDWSMADLSDRLSIKTIAYLNSKSIPEGSTLAKLVKSLKKTELTKELLVIYGKKKNASGDWVGTLSVKIPKLDEDDEGSQKGLASLLELACLVHGVNSSNLGILVGDEGKIVMSSTFWNLTDKLKASARSTTGDYNGPHVVIEGSGYKAPPPCLLASMRVLQSKDSLLRRRKFPTNSGLKPVTYFMLQQAFNGYLGIKSEDQNAYAVRLLKAILASCVKSHNAGFPGGWIHKNREVNKVKSDAGLISVLGWVEKVASHHKLLEVFFNPVDTKWGKVDDKDKIIDYKLVNLTKSGRDSSFQEFRTAVLLSVNRFDSLGNIEDIEKDLQKEPLDIKNQEVVKNYEASETQPIVESLNQAYAFKVSAKDPKKKTTLAHYAQARGHLLALTANKQIKDAKGRTYDSFTGLPEQVQTLLRKKYRYPLKNKRQSDQVVDNTTSHGLTMDTNVQNQRLSTSSTKLTKGQAAQARADLSRKAKRRETP